LSSFESAVEGLESFPSFAPLFDEQQRWLHVLHLPTGDPFAEIRTQISRTETAVSEIEALLSNRNHRCHLVAGAALLCGGATPQTIAALWRTLDAGTWAAAQLCACAYLIDPDFEAQAKRRILDGKAWPKLRGALFGLAALVKPPAPTLLAQVAGALEDEEARNGRHYAIDWLERVGEVSADADRARWLRSPPRAAASTAP
jgi:hypothetical protein